MAEADLSQVRFKLSSQELVGSINLNADAWRVLSNIDGVRSLAEIAQKTGMDQAVVTNIASTLYKAGLLELAPGSAALPRAIVNGKVLERVRGELVRAIGPLADVILEEEIAALGETRAQFPRDRLAELIERVSEAIKDNNKRLNFQRLMLEVLRES